MNSQRPLWCWSTVTTSAAEPATRLVAIEQLQVGQRVRADAPTDELDLQFGTEVVSEDWRKLTLLAPKRDGSTADVVLLRPLTWLNEQQAEVGGTVFISVPECGIDGNAQVLAIEPCPEILPGDGRVITGTFRHQVSASISLSIAGQQEPILCTGNHPFWSEDRHDFVRADSLKPNETLRTTSGSTTVTSLTHIPGSTAVYNLEIHGTHVYHVGSSGVLVHNGNPLCPELMAKIVEQIPADIKTWSEHAQTSQTHCRPSEKRRREWNSIPTGIWRENLNDLGHLWQHWI